MTGGLEIDDATLLKHYRLGDLNPSAWQDVDQNEDGFVQAISSPTAGGAFEAEVKDPLGLGAPIDFSRFDGSIRAAVMTSSKTFDPKTFISAVHPDLSYQDLSRGIAHLKGSIEARSESIRLLVEEDFDRFVSVKSSTDAVYAEMKEGLLAKDSDYASQPLKEHLKNAMQKADQIFQPVLENSAKTEKARATLGVFERSKFLFNLPGYLRDSIAIGRYDAALRDYKKGKFLLESRSVSSVSSSSGKNGRGGKGAEDQHRRILEKVWQQVEKVMEELRGQLMDKLANTSLAISVGKAADEHERTIEVLLELGGPDDPVWTFLDSQHKRILDRLRVVYNEFFASIEDCKASMNPKYENKQNADASRSNQIRRCLEGLKSKQPEQIIAQEPGHEIWLAIVALVRNLSEVLVNSLPLFWKVAKGYMDGRLKKFTSSFQRSPDQFRAMALEMTDSFIDLLSTFFSLSDISTAQLPSTSVPPWLPSYCNSFTDAHFLSNILSIVSETSSDMNQIISEIYQDDQRSGFKTFLENIRWKFGDLLSCVWKNDAKIFYNLESWQFDTQLDPKGKPIMITTHLASFESFQRHLTTMAFKIAGGLEVDFRSGTVKQNQISREYKSKIMKTFLDSLYAFLDGLVHLASEEGAPATVISPTKTNFGPKGLVDERLNSSTGRCGSYDAEADVEAIDVQNNDTRLLLVVSNLVYAHDTLLPSMFNELETAFAISESTDRKGVLEMTKSLDRTLFDDFVEKKAAFVIGIIRSGILDASIDWYEMPPPTEVRPYMYDALMSLVEVHALVSKVARRLLDRALQAIMELVAAECLACFKQIPRFGIGGMLRATLEIEFMHQTVSRYTTDNKTESILVEVYNSISQSYSRRSGDEQIQTYLGNVKKTLAETRKSTGIAFMCFRPNRGEDSRRKEKEKDGSTSGRPSASISATSISADSGQVRSTTPRQPRPPRRSREESISGR